MKGKLYGRSLVKTITGWIGNVTHRMSVVLFLLITCCIILPTVMFVQGVYNNSIDQFKEILIKNIQMETDSYARLMEQKFQMIRYQTYSVLLEENVDALNVKFNFTKYDKDFLSELESLQSNLKMIKLSHTLIDDVALYYPRNLRKVSIGTQMKYEEDQEKIEEIITGSNGRNIWNDSQNIMVWNSKGSSYLSGYEDYDAILMVEISQNSMKHYFDTLGRNATVSWGVYAKNGASEEFFRADNLLLKEYLPKKMSAEGHKLLAIEGEDYLLTWSEIQEGMHFFQMMSFDELNEVLEQYKKKLNLLAALIEGLVVGFAFLIFWMIQKPIRHAKETFMRMENGELGVQMGQSWYVEFQEMYSQFDRMSMRIKDLIEQEYQLKLLKKEAELKQLQYQINPHFLYNTYFNLCGLIQDMDYENAEKMAGLMGKYLRYITISGNHDATVKEELEHARTYARIQQMRFSNRVSVTFEPCPESLEQRRIPKLIVQPLIENAFAHGIRERTDGGIIRVDVEELQNGDIRISVEDNGTDLTEEKLEELKELLKRTENFAGESVALINIQRRLTIQYEDGSGLFVSRSELGGLLCKLVICEERKEADAKNSGSR